MIFEHAHALILAEHTGVTSTGTSPSIQKLVTVVRKRVGQRNADGWESPSATFGAAGQWQMSARPARTNLRGQVRHTGHGRRSKLKRDEAPRHPRRRSTAHLTPDHYARKALSSGRATSNSNARRHSEVARSDPLLTLACNDNLVTWLADAGIPNEKLFRPARSRRKRASSITSAKWKPTRCWTAD